MMINNNHPFFRSLILPFLALVSLLLALALNRSSQAAPNGTFLVNTIADTDDGVCDAADCTLREAINAANSAAGADVITFSIPPSATITLSGTELPTIDDELTIDGSTAANLTISGAGLSRIFTIGSGLGTTITNLTIADGQASDGGGIYNVGILTISGSTFRDNFAGSNGGAVYNYNGTGLTVNNSTFNGNSSNGDGGAIFGSGFGLVVVNNSTFSGNSSGKGGAIYNFSTLVVSNSTFSDNSSGSGGGLYNSAGGTATISSSTFSDNFAYGATGGGGIKNSVNSAILHISNNIIANSDSGGDCVNDGTIGTNLNNLVEDGSCSPAFSGDPLLGPLQDNGGPTKTHILLSGSPAIDRADAPSCAASPVNNRDQRGVPRPLDGDGDGTAVCDIGSVEMGTAQLLFLPVAVKAPD